MPSSTALHGPIVLDHSAATLRGASDRAEPSPVSAIRRLLRDLSQAVRMRQLYQHPDHPIYQLCMLGLRAQFRELWSLRDRIEVNISRDAMTWQEQEILRMEDGPASLLPVLRRHGIRRLGMQEGFEHEELDGFLDAIQRVRSGEASDLAAILHDQGFRFLHCTWVGVFSEEMSRELDSAAPPTLASPIARSAEPEEAIDLPNWNDAIILPGTSTTPGDALVTPAAAAPNPSPSGTAESPRRSSLQLDQLDPTLYGLERAEFQALMEELSREKGRDVVRDVHNALLDTLEDASGARRVEAAEILGNLVPALFDEGRLDEALYVFQELGALAKSERAGKDLRDLATAVVHRVNRSESVKNLFAALARGAVALDVAGRQVLADQLEADILFSLLWTLGTCQNSLHAQALEDIAERLSARLPDALIDALRASDTGVVVAALRVAARLQLTRSAAAVALLLQHRDADVRRAAVEVCFTIRHPMLLNGAVDSLSDPDRQVRVAAARGLGALRYRPAFAKIRAFVEDGQSAAGDVTESVAFFEAYGKLGGSHCVPALERILNGRTWLRRRRPPALRGCAAIALGQIGGRTAIEALQRAAADGEPLVRSAVGRVLRAQRVIA